MICIYEWDNIKLITVRCSWLENRKRVTESRVNQLPIFQFLIVVLIARQNNLLNIQFAVNKRVGTYGTVQESSLSTSNFILTD